MREGLRREVIVLVALVLAIDLVFGAIYFLAGLRGASDAVKLGFTVLWTLATLTIVLRGLTRLRKARLQTRSTRV